MKRPSKKEIKARIDGLKSSDQGTGHPAPTPKIGKLSAKRDGRRIRKQGI